MQNATVTVYTLSGCVHCRRAIALLRRRDIDHDVVYGDAIPGFRGRMMRETGGYTVPQIVIGTRPIGGAAQLARLDRAGVLRALVHGEPLPVVRVRRRRLRPARSRWIAESFDESGRRLARATGADGDAARHALRAA